jgi:hypothetical protein
MISKFGTHHLHEGKIYCRCGKTGTIIWEDAPSAEGDRREFVKIEGDFYERISKQAPHPIELVCNSCGAARPGPIQP